MLPELSLDRTSPIPLSEQIRSQLRLLIVAGQLKPGELLPTIKELARRLKVNPNTVSEVYSSLESQGYLSGHKRGGTRVSQNPPALEPQEVLALQLSARLAREACRLGLSPAQMARWITAQVALLVQPQIKVAALGNTATQAQRWAERVQAWLGEEAQVDPVALGEGLDSGYLFVAVEPQMLHPARSFIPAVARPNRWRSLPAWARAYYEGPQGAD
ncbi:MULTISPECIES: GntR family transcriptional regulator [unclassified Meiothermus]|uniref:GntR family transcriptional regulator n=1 Tax=unclassified Meiothermus TaxID=370471 RepID=UPI000D7C356F|nr:MULTISPECIES: GntR family transcriptional regulator [unclassified Meiothermus]PZA06659.1 hypothetical protein DNA98_11730 [Meiothermus sp. Pnk-1]RYM29178.1 GntR family transcriptional regulator [Meiothermus sp. PNK-Is4]